MGRISGARFEVVRLEREEPFVIASGSSSCSDNVLVFMRGGRLEGMGVACPNSVTGETTESITRFLEKNLPRIEGREIDIERLHQCLDRDHPAAMAGVDAALYDLIGKEEGMPVHRLLGRAEESMETSVTVGIMELDATVERAVRWVDRGFTTLKVKAGLDLDEDVRRIGAVRDAVGPGIRIRVDCNQGYSIEEAVHFSTEIEGLGIEFIEQPVEGQEALIEVSRYSPLPVMADECVRDAGDVQKLGKAGVPLINLKLAKCGGIFPALRMAEMCERYGVSMMVGCMSECQASIAAGLHFALSQPAVRYADLDSFLTFINDPTYAVDVSGGRLFPRPLPGLGATRVDG